MNYKFKGKSVKLDENKDYDVLLISISEEINTKLHDYFAKQTLIELIPIFNEEFGINPKDILAYGKGNPSHKTIQSCIKTKGLYWDKDKETTVFYYPCFCGTETDPAIRSKELLSPVLHYDAESSFNCARERLLLPDYALILKVNKNGKNTEENTDRITE